MRPRGWRRWELGPWLVLGLLGLIFTWPLVRVLGQAVNDPVDPLLNTWILAWDAHAVLAHPLKLLDANIFYPYPRALLYSETLLVPGLWLTPVQAALGNPVLAYNLMVLLGFLSTAWAGYLLGRWATGDGWGGLLLGTVLAFNSYTSSVLPKAQLLQFVWTPLALLYAGREVARPRWRNGLFLALFLALQFHTTVYYGFFAFLAVALAGGVAWVGRVLRSRRWEGKAGNRRRLAGLVLGGLSGALLCLPLGLAYYRLSAELGLHRTLADAWPFSASLTMWITPPAHSLLYAWLPVPSRPSVGVYPVEALFPGLGLPLLALWGLRHGPRYGPLARADVRGMVALLSGVFFVLSLGPYLQVRSLAPDFQIVLPYAWLHTWLPGFDALRAPARFAILVYLGLGLLAAGGLSRIPHSRLRGGLVALIFLEALSLPGVGRFTPPAPRPVHTWLAEQPPGVMVELPAYFPTVWAREEADRWLAAQYHSTVHWQTTPAGYSGFVPPRHVELLTLLNRFPAPESARLLQDLGVRWVVLRGSEWTPQAQAQVEAAAQAQGWTIQEVGGDRVVILPPGPQRVPPQVRYLIPETAQADGRLGVSAVYTAPGMTTLPPAWGLERLQALWYPLASDTPVLTAKVPHQPPFLVDRVAVATVEVPTPTAPATYRLRLRRADGALLAEGTVTVQAVADAPELRVLPVLPLAACVLTVDKIPHLQVTMRTVGWYDEAFTLSARIVAEDGQEIARSLSDVEFPPYQPRSHLLTTHTYSLPLSSLPGQNRPWTVHLAAYHWSQPLEDIVPRAWITPSGEITQRFTLPLTPCTPS